MANKVETHNRFRIFAEVEAEELGPRLVQLANLGLQNIGHELITDVITFKGNGPRKVHDITGDAFAAAWVAEHPTFRANELVHHFRDSERTDGSAYTALRNMVAEKVVVKVAPGMYRRTDVKELEAPKENQRGKHSKVRFEVSNWDFIRNAMKHRKRITSEELRTMFKEDGRNDKSISPIIAKMRDAKLIKNIGIGEYEILKAPAKNTKLNGTSTSEETTHG